MNFTIYNDLFVNKNKRLTTFSDDYYFNILYLHALDKILNKEECFPTIPASVATRC